MGSNLLDNGILGHLLMQSGQFALQDLHGFNDDGLGLESARGLDIEEYFVVLLPDFDTSFDARILRIFYTLLAQAAIRRIFYFDVLRGFVKLEYLPWASLDEAPSLILIQVRV